MAEGSAIAVSGLGRRYGSTLAVDAIDLDVADGEFFGFLGPNGAGKTTMIRMLTTLLRPSHGVARVAGHDVTERPLDVRRAIGVVFQETTLDLDLTAEENLRFCARLYGLSRAETRSRVAETLELFGLAERRKERVRSFSGGMRRSLDLARGILHRPAILFLDEPTLGLDPPQRRRVWEHLRGLRREHDMTLFLTTHYLEEADPCDRVAIIDHGRLVLVGEPEQLKQQLRRDSIELEVRGGPDDVGDLVARVYELTGEHARSTPHGCSLPASDTAGLLQRLLPLTAAGVTVHVRRPTLDDVFMHATEGAGEAAR